MVYRGGSRRWRRTTRMGWRQKRAKELLLGRRWGQKRRRNFMHAEGLKAFVPRPQPQNVDICTAQERQEEGEEELSGGVCGVSTEITVDSAADESVCPRRWAEQFGTGPKRRQLLLVNASGGPIAHYGSRQVAFQPQGSAGQVLGVGFEVTDVKKPLLSVKCMCEKGHTVHFGPKDADNFIQNIVSGERLQMQRRGNSYVIRGELCGHNPF